MKQVTWNYWQSPKEGGAFVILENILYVNSVSNNTTNKKWVFTINFKNDTTLDIVSSSEREANLKRKSLIVRLEKFHTRTI